MYSGLSTAAVLFFDEWSSADGTEFKNDIVLIFDFDRDDRVQTLTVVFDTFRCAGNYGRHYSLSSLSDG